MLVRAGNLCLAGPELESRLQRMDQLHREVYPVAQLPKSPGALSGLAHSGRPYTQEGEARLWQWSRVTADLVGRVVMRRVSRNGMVSLYNHDHYVGNAHRNKNVDATFDPQTNEWVFADAQGRELRHKQAQQITPERVMALDITDRRK